MWKTCLKLNRIEMWFWDLKIFNATALSYMYKNVKEKHSQKSAFNSKVKVVYVYVYLMHHHFECEMYFSPSCATASSSCRVKRLHSLSMNGNTIQSDTYLSFFHRIILSSLWAWCVWTITITSTCMYLMIIAGSPIILYIVRMKELEFSSQNRFK